MPYQHRSGNVKRKERIEREERKALDTKNQPTLQSFFKLNVSRSSNNFDSNLTERESSDPKASNSRSNSADLRCSSEQSRPETSHQEQNDEASLFSSWSPVSKKSDAHEKLVGAQSHILRENSQAVYSPCGSHSLNLCGVDSAECCIQAITFFGVVQKCYNIFSGSPQRWEILKKHVPSSLHSQSDTRWSARIEAFRPFASHIAGLTKALQELKKLNLTADSQRDINGILKYMTKFECVLMASIWSKILSSINERNVVLQAKAVTIDVEVANLSSLLTDLNFLRDRWGALLKECKLVATALQNTVDILADLPSQKVGRKRKRRRVDSDDENEEEQEIYEETNFQRNTFFVILDSVISGLTTRFDAAKNLNDTFNFLWKFPELDEDHIRDKATDFVQKYPSDVSDELRDEMTHLKHIYSANFKSDLNPLSLLNEINEKNLNAIFANVCVALRIFCTLPVTVASAERFFSVLERIKNFQRSCSSQARISRLATLCLEYELARKLNFSHVIDSIASEKARKACLK